MATPDNRRSRSGHAGWRPHAAAVWLAALAVPAVLAAGDTGRDPGRRDPAPRLETISSRVEGPRLSVLLQLTEPAAYATSQPDPLTVLVDLRNVSVAGAANRFKAAAHQPVAAVTLEERTGTDGVVVARVRVRLAEPTPYRVRSERNVIRVDVDRPQPGAGVVAAAPPGPTGATPPPVSDATVLDTLRVGEGPDGPWVMIGGNGRLPPATSWMANDPPRLVLDLPGVTPQVAAETLVGRQAVERVRVALNRRMPSVTRLVVDLARPLGYDIRPDGDTLRVVFRTGSAAPPVVPWPAPLAPALEPPALTPAASAVPAHDMPLPASVVSAAPAEDAPPPLPTQIAADPPLRIPIPEDGIADKVAQPAVQATRQTPPPMPATAPPVAVPQTPPPMPATASPVAAPQTPPPPVPAAGTLGPAQPAGRGEQKYTGVPISLDFAGVDLRSVLRMFADISGLNVVIDPNVKGNVDIALRDIPWDQALEIILRSNQLGYSVEGTVVRIAPLTVLADEEAQRRKLADEQALGGELEILTRTLSYAKAEDMRGLLEKGALTKRGQAQVDPRTNTLIIRDLPPALEAAAMLMDTLDRPQPQVEIEARILQTNRNFARKLGAQLGFLGRAASDLGNTLPLAFPNQAGVSGRTGAIQGASGGAAVPSGVNLPVLGATSAIGLTLGAVNGAFNIDAVLSAAEESGQGRLLSSPRVFAQNNFPAEITQGVQIPIQTIANNTVTVTFKDAALSLKVTPQINANDTIVLNVELENASPDYTRQINNIPPIDTQRAITQIMVRDGQTAVLGGVNVSQEQAKTERTPGLGKIPVLGWLFRREDISDANRELLIFITPRIIK